MKIEIKIVIDDGQAMLETNVSREATYFYLSKVLASILVDQNPPSQIVIPKEIIRAS